MSEIFEREKGYWRYWRVYRWCQSVYLFIGDTLHLQSIHWSSQHFSPRRQVCRFARQLM